MNDATTYHSETNPHVIGILENVRKSGVRVRLQYGDVKTGKDWGEYEKGTIGRSMGPTRVPLLIKTRRSLGGAAILDHCIVKISETIKPYRTLYQHSKYHFSQYVDGK